MNERSTEKLVIGDVRQESAYLPRRSVSVDDNEWIGPLDYNESSSYRPTVECGFEQNAYLITWNTLDRPPMLPRVLEKIDETVVYRSLPLAEIYCSEKTAIASAELLGATASVMPALRGIRQSRNVAVGIDFLLWNALNQYSSPPWGEELGGYPILKKENKEAMVSMDSDIKWTVRKPIMPIINLSLGPKALGYAFSMNDIVNLATAGAARRGLLVVVAAGNDGKYLDIANQLSAWSMPEWVLSVGATEDEEGKTLADYSSRGSATIPDSGPDLVACGRSLIEPHPVGTSFAAPVISYCAVILSAALLQLRHAFSVVSGNATEGVPLVGLGFVDDWNDECFWSPSFRWPILALPIVGINWEGVEGIHKTAKRYGAAIDIDGGPSFLRSFLLEAAKPIVGFRPHEIGRGFLSVPILLDVIGRIDGRYIANTFGDAKIDSLVANELTKYRVFRREELEQLACLVLKTAPETRYSWRSCRWSTRPMMNEDLNELTDYQRKYGIAMKWPPSDER